MTAKHKWPSLSVSIDIGTNILHGDTSTHSVGFSVIGVLFFGFCAGMDGVSRRVTFPTGGICLYDLLERGRRVYDR